MTMSAQRGSLPMLKGAPKTISSLGSRTRRRTGGRRPAGPTPLACSGSVGEGPHFDRWSTMHLIMRGRRRVSPLLRRGPVVGTRPRHDRCGPRASVGRFNQQASHRPEATGSVPPTPGRLPTASTGREAVELAPRLHSDVVLMDVRMPDLDGIAATRKMSRAAPEARA
jgi:Response regulator receiver domain